MVAALSALPLGAYAQERVALEVGTVLATSSSTHVDAQLASVRGQLERLFQDKGYTSYRLVKQEKSEVSCGNPASFEIPGGRHLQVMAKDTRGGRVSLNVALVKDRHTLMRTDLTLGKRGTIMVGGPRFEDGVLIIWIGARRMSTSSTAPQRRRRTSCCRTSPGRTWSTRSRGPCPPSARRSRRRGCSRATPSTGW